MKKTNSIYSKFLYTFFVLSLTFYMGCTDEDVFDPGLVGTQNPGLTPTMNCTGGLGVICLTSTHGGNGFDLSNSVVVTTLNNIGDSVSISATGNIELSDGRVIPPAGGTVVPPDANATYPFGAPAGITMIYFAQNGSPVTGPMPLGDGGVFYKGREGALQTPTEVRAYINVLDTAAIQSGFRELTATGQGIVLMPGPATTTTSETQTVVLEPNNDRPWLGLSSLKSKAGSYNIGDTLEITNVTNNPIQNVTTPHAQHAPATLAFGSATIGKINYAVILSSGYRMGPEIYASFYQPFDGRNWGTIGISGDGVNYVPLNYNPATQSWVFTIPSGFFGGSNSGLVYFAVAVLREWRDNLVTLGGAGINVTVQ
jgi:hypothetical protein